MGRLLTVTKDGTLIEEYQYDSVGRRSYEMNVPKGISGTTFSYSEEDHLLTAGDVTYQYDLDGFLTSKTQGSDVTQYTYSSRGELLSVNLPDGRVIEYVNDPLGRRMAKKVDGVITEKYIWEGLTRLLAVFDGSNNLLMRFEYADSRMPMAMTSGGVTYYLAYDQVGSLRVVADASGTVIKRIDYDSFGSIISDSNPAFDVPFGFAGGLHDRDTGLVRFGFRDYDPDVGRWTAKDPIGFWGGDTDLYGYCENDPINWFDLAGLFTNPTGGRVRGQDVWGSGHYRASRDGGTREHPGVDYSGEVGGSVVAPISGSMEVCPKDLGPNAIRITSSRDQQGVQYSAVLRHVNPCDTAGKSITEGQQLGKIEDLSTTFPGITPHAHLELYKIQNGKTRRVNPGDYIP